MAADMDVVRAALARELDAWDAALGTPTPLVLHLDVNGTIMLGDSTKERSLAQSLNAFLANKYGAADEPWPAKGRFTEVGERGAAHRDEWVRLHAIATALPPTYRGVMPAYLAAAPLWASLAPRVRVVFRTFGVDTTALAKVHALCGLPPITHHAEFRGSQLFPKPAGPSASAATVPAAESLGSVERKEGIGGGVLAWLDANPTANFLAIRDDYAHWKATGKREGKLLVHSARVLQLFFDDNHSDPIVHCVGPDHGTTALLDAPTADILAQPQWFRDVVPAALATLRGAFAASASAAGLAVAHAPVHVLVTGSRDWTDVEAIRAALDTLPRDAVLVHGGCRGADAIAAALWVGRGGSAVAVPAEWHKHGARAGPLRNAAMLSSYPVAAALAFPLPHSKGTVDMMAKLAAARIPTTVIPPTASRGMAGTPT